MEEFYEFDVTRACVTVWALLVDTSSLLAAAFHGWEYPIAHHDLWGLLASAALLNMGREDEDKVSPYLPFSTSENAATVEVTDEELQVLRAQLNAFSAIPTRPAPNKEE